MSDTEQVIQERIAEYRTRLANAKQDYKSACFLYVEAKFYAEEAFIEANEAEQRCKNLVEEMDAIEDSLSELGAPESRYD